MTECRAAKYRRISDDREGRELGVTRQDEDLDELARRRGYTIVASYADNDIGASTRSRKPRPDYQRMLDAARAGHFEVILAYTSGRLTRRPREHEDLIELAERHGVAFEYVRSPSFDLNTSAGRRVARILAANDAAEAEDISERVTRARLQQAQEGRYGGGRRPYGFEADGVTVRESEAAEIVKAADGILAGVTLRATVADLNRRGVPTVSGRPWTSVALKGMLCSPRTGGLVAYQGEVLEDATASWSAILPRETWEAVRHILTDPSRRTSPGSEPRWLGSGMYRCGHPEHIDADPPIPMRAGTAGNGLRAYRCRDSAHMVRSAASLDDFVEQVVIETLSRPDAADLLVPRIDIDVAACSAQANGLRVRIVEARSLWEDGVMSAAEYRASVARMRDKLAEVEAKLTAASGRDPLAGIAGNPDAAKVWDGLDLGRRRAVLDALAVVTVLPTKRGRYFDPVSVKIDPR